MVAYLDHFHWKGKLIDCEAYALASPLIDKVDSKGNKDMKTTLETKVSEMCTAPVLSKYQRGIRHVIPESDRVSVWLAHAECHLLWITVV